MIKNLVSIISKRKVGGFSVNTQSVRRNGTQHHPMDDLRILKAKNDDLIIAGYASIEMVDKQNDLITLEALKEASGKFMGENRYRNVMTNHSNVQVGEVIESYRDSQGKLYKTECDDVGFFVVIKLRDDIEKAKEVAREIRKGNLRSFSIGGQALNKKSKHDTDKGRYNEIEKLELHEITICEKGINPEAKFDILKEDKQEKVKKMSELEQALGELNSLLKEVRDLTKEEDAEKTAYMKTENDEVEDMTYGDDDQEDNAEDGMEKEDNGQQDMAEDEVEEADDEGMEQKGVSTLDAGYIEDGRPADKVVVSGGKGLAHPQKTTLSKSVWSSEVSTLDLSHENVEKAYEQFKAEQLEKVAYDNLTKEFESRFREEMSQKENAVAKANYDAKAEVTELKKQFSQLLDSLKTDDTVLKSSVETSTEAPAYFPNDISTIGEMSWAEIHEVADKLQKGVIE